MRGLSGPLVEDQYRAAALTTSADWLCSPMVFTGRQQSHLFPCIPILMDVELKMEMEMCFTFIKQNDSKICQLSSWLVGGGGSNN